MPHPCTLIEEGMRGFEACELGKMAYAAEKVLGEAPVETVTTLREALVANAPIITERLNSALAKIGEWVEATGDFAVEQTPFLVQEILYWGIAEPGFRVGVGVFFLTVAWFWGFTCYRKREDIKNMGGDLGDFMSFAKFAVPVIATVIGVLCIMVNIMDMLKPIVAPRLYLIEYFRHLAG